MKVLYGIKNIKRMPATVVAIGVFDGLHKGHKRVISVVEKRASKIGGTACVVTFDPHPVKVLRPEQGPPRIASLGHRLRMLEEGGIDLAVVIKFSASFARMKPSEFVENVLIKRLGVRELIVGENFHFGKRRSGGAAELKRLSEKHGFSIKTVPMVKGSGKDISSTRIRRLIVSGDLRRASRLLGRNVSILGTVVRGKRRGRKLGFRTANIDPHHEAIPPSGVYAVRVDLLGKRYGGIMNIGTRPTFKRADVENDPSIEVHVFGLRRSIYGQDMEIEFVRKMRDEKRFSSPDVLKKRIVLDVRSAKRILASG